MKEWRPDGWDRAEELCVGPLSRRPEGVSPGEIFEAGASAMYEPAYEKGRAELLEELKEQGLYAEYPEDYIISVQVKPDDRDWAEPFLSRIEQKGWLVFIPEDTREAMR